ncbi:MAG: hypothetical protein M1833_006004 [Piccolia ochrophora]|nr:MAG: hypothetical protein M1833_006004 [Piccolia ochrophora]
MSILPTIPTLLHGQQWKETNPQDSITSSQYDLKRNRRRSRSQEGLLPPLLRFARDPAGSVQQLVDGLRDGLDAGERAERVALNNRKQVLEVLMKNASTYEEWRSSAVELDTLEGNDVWKFEDYSENYDHALVESRLKTLDDARLDCDAKKMLFLIRTSLTRELGDMCNVNLYKYSHVGTKNLIERYIDSALETISALLSLSAAGRSQNLTSRLILEHMLSARQAFGRSALLLSGGATFGMNHIGVLKTLWENRLLPRIISGASAGSIVSAVVCSQTDEEIPELLKTFAYGDLSVFELEGLEEGILTRVARFLKMGAWIDIAHLMRVMKDLLGDMTFQEAYNRTRRILNICVSSASLYELPRLLNYVTAPNVLIWSAVAASCSVPFVFTSAALLAKDPKTGEAVPWNPSPQRYIDGSVDNDLPMTRLAEMFNVNHFIVSQVNPHVIPFLERGEDILTGGAQPASGPADWGYTMMNLAKAEAMHRMHVLAELGIFPNILTKAQSVLRQKYSGDITIFPEISYADFPRMLKNPTTEFMLQATLSGSRATWPRLSRIRNHCAIELALDDAVQQLRARVVFSPSQVDLRLNSIGSVGSRAGVPPSTAPLSRPRPRQGRSSAKDIPTNASSSNPVNARRTSHTKSVSSPPPRRHRISPPSLPQLQIPHPLADFTSSGADESTHSPPTSTATSPSTTSTSSPTSPALPALSRPMNPLFPFASQPATPKAGKPDWSSPDDSAPTRCPSPASSDRAGLALMMTRTAGGLGGGEVDMGKVTSRML